MSFFGLTHLGYQNVVKEASVKSQQDPIRSKTQLGYLALPPLKDHMPMQKSIIPINDVSQYGKGPDRSYNEYVRLRAKHVRNPLSPHDIYLRPATTAHDIGWWTKDEPLRQNHPWTYVPRRVTIHSEMSRFVDEMKLTNRQFTLF
ncbi:testis-expressed protein 49-like [Physella acuta]|uniref:testis-expressed protein 49-like n=1 Tax=Physella acuta TaxID=109671 RepID=UPI0027DCB534|nr:testis-expressed protein 49-like [Physella acuta]